MPRLPQIVADRVPQGGELSIGSAMAPGEALAGFGRDVTDIGSAMAQKQIELQRTRQLMEVTSTGALAANTVYESTIADPSVPNEKLSDTVQKGLQTVHDTIAQGIKDPIVRLRFDENFNGLTQQHVVRASSLQREREISASVAQLNGSNDTLAKQAVDATGQGQDALVAQIHANVAGAVAHKLITPEQGQKELGARLQEIQTAKTIKAIRENPHQALTDLQGDAYSDLDPVRRQDFIDQATNQALAQDHEAARLARQSAEDADKAATRKAELVTAQDVDLARDGKLPLTVLQQHLKDFNLSATQYDLIRNYIEKEPTSPSNRDTLDDMAMKVRSAYPSQSLKGQLGQLFQDHRANPSVGLNREDYMALDNELTTNLHHGQDESRSDVRYRHGQAERQIDDAFGVSGIDAMISRFGPDVQQARSLAQKYLFDHSAATGGHEEPLTLVPRILKTYLPLAQTAMQARIKGNMALVPERFRVLDANKNLKVAESAAAMGTVGEAGAHGLTQDQWYAGAAALKDLGDFQGVLSNMQNVTDGITVVPENK